jgi:hypothetical protein
VGLEQARTALEDGDFAQALSLLDGVDESEAALEVRAAAAYGAGRLELALTSWERLFALHVAAGRREDAAFAAALVALNLLCETGLMAPVRGWLARAERHIAGEPPGRVHALLAIVGTYERILCGDPDAAVETAAQAVALGTAHGVDPARGLGRVAVARLTIHAGDVERGIALLDELAVDLAAGELDPLTTGNVYCELICTAQWVGRQDRAREWTDVMERWREGRAFGATHGRCRVHRAELLRLSGPAAEAEEEALTACAELRPWMRREYGWPLVELGNIRLRRGDLVGAEDAFLQAHERAWSPQPGLALLRLEQGDVETAASMLRTELELPSDLPWKERPPFGELHVLPILAAQAEVAAVAGDAATARAAADRLTAIAETYPSPGLDGCAAVADARAALLEGDTTRAAQRAQAATVAWIDLGAPYDAASARTVLGEALAAAGNPSGAALEWKAAAAAYAEFGAPLREAAVRARLESGANPPTRAPTLPAGLRASLVRRGDHWEVGFGGRTAMLADLKGLRYLAALLAVPGRELHVLDLVGSDIDEAGIPVLDEEAKASYRRRLAEVEEDLAEAERDHDDARRALAERDRDYLVAELTAAVGLGGRARTTGGTAERARGAVTRSLRYALSRLGEQHPALGAHLARTVRTGAHCSYQPDPLSPVEWRVEA